MNVRTTQTQTAQSSQSVDRDLESLRSTLATVAECTTGTPQLAAIQSQTRVLRRHLNRLFDLEELDDYLQFVVARHPHLDQQVSVLRAEHADFRTTINGLLERLDRLEAEDQQQFDVVCLEIHAVICRILAHGRAEGHLLSKSLGRDEGGEG
jgi:hemerythrin-like domain-containing protein